MHSRAGADYGALLLKGSGRQCHRAYATRHGRKDASPACGRAMAIGEQMLDCADHWYG